MSDYITTKDLSGNEGKSGVAAKEELEREGKIMELARQQVREELLAELEKEKNKRTKNKKETK